ncbi:MAG: peptidase M50 [Pseudomonadota bacterium]
MSGFESQSWYRVAHLRPCVAARIEVTRQMFRGQPWFVMRDPVSGKFNRMTEAAYTIVAMMDGERPLGEIWDLACEELGDDAPTQDELLGLVSQLHLLDLISTDTLPEADRVAQRARKIGTRGVMARFMNPLAVRFPLFDPDTFLEETLPLVRPLFSWFGALLYLALLIAGGLTAAQHWDELTGGIIDRVFAAESLLILLLVYPVIKAVHELGHGYAVKYWGGEVREMGVMLLVFIPVPYVDASAASGFPSKWSRALVGGMGIIVEIGIAAACMLIWTELEEGFWRAVCFNAMVIGGVSTLLFNGNPLLRFDGYYVMADLIEIPNLGKRANRYLGYLLQRRLFGVKEARNPARAPGEGGWFFFYSIAAFAYRLVIAFAIVSLVANQFFFIGVLLAIWATMLMFGMPLAKHIHFLFFNDMLRGKRARAMVVALSFVALLIGALGFVPVPYRTVVEGVVYAGEEATIYASEAGTVAEVVAPDDGRVAPQTPIIRLTDDFADAELRALEAEVDRTRLRYALAVDTDAFSMRLWRAELAHAEAELQTLRDRIDALTVVSPGEGELVLPYAPDLVGRYLEKGDVIGQVIDPALLVARIAVPQSDADLIRRRSNAVEIRPAEDISLRQEARIVREVPAVGGLLPSFALSTEGGGELSLDPSAPAGQARSIEPVMQFEIATLEPILTPRLGTRVYVRFDHGSEPLASRLWRRVRQLFLSRFNV